MSNITFNSFPKADPNDNGLNNAAILTFSKDVLDSLIKELTQNSIDALKVRGSKLKIRVRMAEIEKEQIPNIGKLDEILTNMMSYEPWKKQPDFINFFKNAKEIIASDKINTFIFEDYNTKGLNGNCEKGTFKSLLIDEGVSDHENKGSLGGFGIGKNSYFAFTGIQTVFYSSFNEEGPKFMGVTKLAEYRDRLDKKRNNRIYYGLWNNEFPGESSDLNLIDNDQQIPTFFKRKEDGLSSFALGVTHDAKWQNHTKQALIKNYWFLLENDKLEADIDGEILNKDNYFEIAKSIFTEDKTILSFITTFRNPQINETANIIHIKTIKILINEAPEGEVYPNKVVYIRDGMMIKESGPGARGLPNTISGIIYCDNAEGNEILGKMEPPAHNEFVPYLLPKKSQLSEFDGKQIVSGMNDAKKMVVKLLKDKYNESTSSVAIVDELLNGIPGQGSSGGSGNSTKNDVESFTKLKKEMEIDVGFDSIQKSTKVFIEEPNENSSNEGIDGGISGANNSKSAKTNGKGIGIGEGELGSGKIGGNNGLKKARNKPVNEIKASIFFSGKKGENNLYKLIIYSETDVYNTTIGFNQYGDGKGSITTELISVKNVNGNYSFQITDNGYIIIGINLQKGVRNVFDIEFKEIEQSAFKFIY